MNQSNINFRTCIVLKQSMEKENLLRFVIFNNALVFDITEKLPGVGIWVSADYSLLKQAIQKHLFSKNAHQNLNETNQILLDVENLFLNKIFDLLTLSNKTGSLVYGFEKVKKALNQNQVLALFESQNNSIAQENKLLGAKNIPIFKFFNASKLGAINGNIENTHIALTKNTIKSLMPLALKYQHFLKTKG